VNGDFELLHRWREGEKAAGNELFQRHFESIRRFFRNKANVEDAEDLIQRTFLACVESVPKFRGEASFRTYLFTIARRELCHYIRRKVKAGEREEPDLTVSSIADYGISPSVVALKMQEQAIIVEAMRRIPIDFQITLELYYWEQLQGPELAEVLGISPTTVRTRLHRAREALRDMLEKLEAPGSLANADLGASVHALRERM
jgi:RNA polymerase sigma factor (sigma-70 family)